jgi:hypothetical protein
MPGGRGEKSEKTCFLSQKSQANSRLSSLFNGIIFCPHTRTAPNFKQLMAAQENHVQNAFNLIHQNHQNLDALLEARDMLLRFFDDEIFRLRETQSLRQIEELFLPPDGAVMAPVLPLLQAGVVQQAADVVPALLPPPAQLPAGPKVGIPWTNNANVRLQHGLLGLDNWRDPMARTLEEQRLRSDPARLLPFNRNEADALARLPSCKLGLLVCN